MIRHLFKLIWNKKKQNFLLISEMFVAFIVIFAVFTLLVYDYKNYREPVGFDYNNVWVVNYNPPENLGSVDSVTLFYETLRQLVMSMPQVKEMTFTSGNVPYSFSSSNTETGYGKEKVLTNVYQAQETYAKVLEVSMLHGHWFQREDNIGKVPPVVINQKLKEKLFGNGDAIGKIIGSDEDKLKIIGVAANIKDKSEFQAVEYGMYRKMDTGFLKWTGNMLLKVKPGIDAAFESKLYKALSNAIGTTIEIEHLDKKLIDKNRLMIIPIIIMVIVAGFLIINVALGLFGVLWYNINKRKGEIGLRRAVGASGNSISKQLVGEAMVLATISLLIGSFFAVQFPLLNVFDLPAGVYIIALVLAITFIYILVAVCALYPGKQAAGIYPAVALHEE